MGKLSKCTFYIPENKKVYQPGEKVQGHVSVEASDNIQVKGVFLYLFGGALTKWAGALGMGFSDSTGKETYFHSYMSLFSNKKCASASTVVLTKGKHVYRFTFTLPDSGIPSSFEGDYGAIRYWLRFQVALPFPSLNKTWHRFFTVLARTDVNTPENLRTVNMDVEKPISKAMGFGSAGKLSVKASLDRAAYCPGENILINMEIKNESVRDLGAVKVSLTQRAVYTAGTDMRTRNIDIRTLISNSPKLGQGETMTWHQQPLPVDAIPPSSKPRTSHIISVKYFLKIVVEVPYGFNIEHNMPVIIGTVPLKSQQAGELSGAQAAPPTHYRPCQYGFSKFGQSHVDFFAATTYIPWTVCVTHPEDGDVTGATASPENRGSSQQTSVKTADSSSNEREKISNANQLSGPQESSSVADGSSSRTLANSEDWTTYLDAPPTYEEVIEGSEGSVISLGPDDKGAVLVIRFPRSKCADVRDFFTSQQKSLEAFGGHLITFCAAPLFSQSTAPWPFKSSMAVFFFGRESKAVEWFTVRASEDQSLTSDWDVLVAENIAKLPTPDAQYKVCVLAFMEIANTLSPVSAEVTRKWTRQFPSRYFLRSTKAKLLQGKWPGFGAGSKFNLDVEKGGDGAFTEGYTEPSEVHQVHGEEVCSAGLESSPSEEASLAVSDESGEGAVDVEEQTKEGAGPDDGPALFFIAAKQLPDVTTVLKLQSALALDREVAGEHEQMAKNLVMSTVLILPTIDA